MKRLLLVATIVLGVAVIGTSVGWYRAAHPGSPGGFNCRMEQGQLTLRYEYGSGQVVTTQMQQRDGKTVVSLRRQDQGRDRLMPLYIGEVRYSSVEPGDPIEYPNGRHLNCPSAS